MDILQPSGWVRPKGYSNGISATGKLVVTGGMVGWNEKEEFVSENLVGQAKQTFKNIAAVLSEAGATPSHIVRLTWYIKNKKEYLDNQKSIGIAYKKILGNHFPAMSMVVVNDLIEDKAILEIEATAVI